MLQGVEGDVRIVGVVVSPVGHLHSATRHADGEETIFRLRLRTFP